MGKLFQDTASKMRAVFLAVGVLLSTALGAAKPSWISMPYLPTWSTGITLATIPWDDITHIAEAFVLPNPNGTTPTFAAPGQRANLVSTAHANNTYAILSIGGASGFDQNNWVTSTNATYLNTFVTNIMNLVGTHGYDGVDVDWEFPNAGNTTQFTNLIVALNDALKNPANPNYKGLAFDGSPKELSFFMSPGYAICGVNWNLVGSYVDFALLPGYDICDVTGYEGPIDGPWTFTDCRGAPSGSGVGLTVKGNMDKLTGGGANQFSFPKNKLILGMPFYNCAYTALETITASGSHSSFNATVMESTWSSGVYTNDSTAFCAKMNWAFGQGFKGIGMWELPQAYPRNGTAEVAEVWDVIGGKNACVTGPGTPTFTRTRTRTPSPSRTPTPAGSSTFSPTRTPSYSPSPVVSATFTPTASRSRTGTPSHTPFVAPLNSKLNLETRSYNASDLCGAGNNFYVEFRITNHDSVAVDLATVSIDAWFDGEVVSFVWPSLSYTTGFSGGGTATFSLLAGPGCSFGGRDSDQLARASLSSVNLQPGDAALVLVSVWRGGAAPFDPGCNDWSQPGASGSFSDQPDFALNENGVRVCEYLNSSSTDPNSGHNPCSGASNCGPPATPTPTRTAVLTQTASPSRTRSQTATASQTPSATATASPSRTASSTASPSPSSSASPSRTASPTSSATPSGSPSVSITRSPSASLTVTGTPSLTRSPSASSSPSGTPSATPSISPTSSPSGTPSATRTVSVSPSASASPSPTWTGTPSRTVSATPSASFTDSPTITAGPSPTWTATFTAAPSASASPTASPSRTASRTATQSATPSDTGTPTLTDTVTLTPSLSASPSPSPSVSETGTPVPSPSASPSQSPSGTETVIASPSVSPSASASPTSTLSATEGPSPSSSTTVTPSQTATLTGSSTPSQTMTGSPSQTVQPSPSPSESPSSTRTQSPTQTPVNTSSRTATASPTQSAQPSLTQSPSESATVTVTVTSTLGALGTETLTPTPTPPAANAGSDGTLVIEAAAVMPVPIWAQGPAPQLKIRLSGPATGLRWKLYTRSLVLVGRADQTLALTAHWNTLPLDLPAGLASDAYYLELVAQRDAVISKPRLVKLMVLR